MDKKQTEDLLLERKVQVKVGDLLELLCHINNVSSFADTPKGLSALFKKVDYNAAALQYFTAAKSRLINIIDKGLEIETNLQKDLSPFNLSPKKIVSNLKGVRTWRIQEKK